MLIRQQKRKRADKDIQESEGQQTKYVSSKLPTHVTIPEENENKKKNPRNINKKKQQKKSNEDKQYRKLNRQCRKVKSLEQEYRELEEQLKEVKQMVNLQLQLINHTVRTNKKQITSKDKHLSIQENSNVKEESIQQQIKEDNEEQIDTSRLQGLIKQLFSYQETIQTANSNYLLLSQINKEQQSQMMFQVNTLEDRIKQLRFLLNGKEDLLAYQTATFQTPSNDEDIQPAQVYIDYHLPKKISIANLNNMQAEYLLVHNAVSTMATLSHSIEQLQNQLKTLTQQNDTINEEVEQQQQKTFKTPQKNNNKNIQRRGSDQHQPISEQESKLLSPLTSRPSTKSASKFSIGHETTQNRMSFLPLSISNFRSSLIYKVAKLNQLQIQRGKELKQAYNQLRAQYEQEANKKRKLVEEYEIKRDVYSYKKKQLPGRKETLLKDISEEEHQSQSSSTDVNLDNILHELIDHPQMLPITPEQSHSQNQNQITSNDASNSTQTTDSFGVRLSTIQEKTESHLNSSQYTEPNVLPKQENSLFNQITNTPQKNKTNPFLKLKSNTQPPSQPSKKTQSPNQPNGINLKSPILNLSRFSLKKPKKQNPSFQKYLNTHPKLTENPLSDPNNINAKQNQKIKLQNQSSPIIQTVEPKTVTPMTVKIQPSTIKANSNS